MPWDFNWKFPFPRLRDQAATCPNCRVEISKSSATRNLAVEKAVSELPNECQFCNREFPSKSLERHEVQECEERPTNCKYVCIGCPWKGPVHEGECECVNFVIVILPITNLRLLPAEEHQQICAHPRKSGAEVMSAIQAQHTQFVEEKKFYGQLIDLLSYEKIIFSDLQMKPYRTDEYVQKLFYETARFSAFNHQFAVKARINNSQRDPHQSNDRQLSYQLILKTKTSTPLPIHFFVLKGPFSDTKMETKIYKHDFTDTVCLFVDY